MILKKFICLLLTVLQVSGQDYQVADIRCNFPDDDLSDSTLAEGEFAAKLRKPPGFIGIPLFADDRYVNPEKDPTCQIRRDQSDRSGLVYSLLIKDLSRCGVTKKDGYVNVRVWFPQLDGVVLATDQEVIIMCKPASPTIIENRSAGFAGSLPSVGRVTGVVEESPGRLEYEVVLLREAQGRSHASKSHLVDQAVPIGSKLQLRARINTQSGAWKYAKLVGVTVSNDPLKPNAPGHVVLVENGCRRPDYRSIVPYQPKRSKKNSGEVLLEFQAFMLDSRMEGSSQLWIHATIKACVMESDCDPETCLDLHDPSGYGKRRKRSTFKGSRVSLEVDSKSLNSSRIVSSTSSSYDAELNMDYFETDDPSFNATFMNDSNSEISANVSGEGFSTQVGDNVALEVIFPEKFFSHPSALQNSCNAFLVLSTCLGVGLFIAVSFLCFITTKLQKNVQNACSRNLDKVIKEHHTKYGLRDFLDPPFQ